jgi:GSCFA family
MSSAVFPYVGIPKEAKWKAMMEGRVPATINPHRPSTLRILPEHRIASAGSCFAQRIAEALQAAGFNYLVEEKGSPFQSPEERIRQGYGLYSARYGNVYTALQMLQLMRRAYGQFDPVEPLWRLPSGAYVDPFRPAVLPGGFDDADECMWDRQAHLAAVRRVLESADVFIFTLGLTEAWRSLEDGAVFPVCPGGSLGGEYSPDRHAFHNFSVSEVSNHLFEFIDALRAVNPQVQVLLTVSPVPLMATFEDRHVLQATVYSKSVLRVVAEEAVRKYDHVHYFASYEIVNNTGDSKSYFLNDLRSVSSEAVKHVISCFHQQFTGMTEVNSSQQQLTEHLAIAPAGRRPVCDEEQVMSALAAEAQRDRDV